MNSIVLRVGVALVCVCAGCAERPTTSSGSAPLLADVEAPEWRVAAEPLLEIGREEGDSAAQFHRVRGVARLSDGSIVVLDAGSSELRIFGEDGRFVRTAGRRGSGPGEFRRPWALYVRNDTIIVIDPGMERMSMHAADGRFIASRPYDRSRDTGESWLYDGSVIEGGAHGALHGRIRAAVPRLPRPDTAVFFREVRVVGEQELWVRLRAPGDTSSNRWLVFDHAGTPLGRITVPGAFTLHDARADGLLGVWQDSLDVESVRVLGVERSGAPSAARAAAESAPARATASTQAHGKLRSALQAIALYQEHYYSVPAHDYVFAATLEELRSFDAPRQVRQTSLDPPAGVVVRIISGGRFGWFALAADTASGAMCGTGEGFVLPQTWSSQPLACF